MSSGLCRIVSQRKLYLDWLVIVAGSGKKLITKLAYAPRSHLQQRLLGYVSRHCSVQLLDCVRMKV